MGTRKPKEKYIQQAYTTVIKASSRASVKVGDAYYTMEYTEERTIPDSVDVNIEAERKLLWETVNSECDRQVEDVLVTYKK